MVFKNSIISVIHFLSLVLYCGDSGELTCCDAVLPGESGSLVRTAGVSGSLDQRQVAQLLPQVIVCNKEDKILN